jgi:hypothetical protein
LSAKTFAQNKPIRLIDPDELLKIGVMGSESE